MKKVVLLVSFAVAAIVPVSSASAVDQSAPARTTASGAAIVTAGLLTINDFPPGWAESPSKASSNIDLSKYGTTCAALQKVADKAKKLQTGHGQSPDFKQGSTDQISNTVAAYRTAAGAMAALSIFKRPAVASCLQKEITDKAAQSAPAGVRYKASIGRLSVPQVGDETIGYEISIEASKSSLTFSFYLDLQLVRVGQAGLTFSFEGEGTSPMLANQALVQTVVDRVKVAEGATP